MSRSEFSKFAHTNLPQAGFELGSLNPQADVVPMDPSLLVLFIVIGQFFCCSYEDNQNKSKHWKTFIMRKLSVIFLASYVTFTQQEPCNVCYIDLSNQICVSRNKILNKRDPNNGHLLYSDSSLNWPTPSFLYAFFVQRSIFPTSTCFLPCPSPPPTFLST